MKSFLLDTHLLLWVAFEGRKLSRYAIDLIEEPTHELCFSSVSIWEVTIKRGRRKADFDFDPKLLRGLLLDAGYREIAMTSEHALQVATLPRVHQDPFDRLLLARAQVLGSILLTADSTLASYSGSAQLV